MQKFHFDLVDVFTEKPFSGNQLAVFSDASGIPEEAMQPIARELNFSETTFVFPPKNVGECDFRVRIFTPRTELPMAGHPTIGTAFVLGNEGRVPSNGDGSLGRKVRLLENIGVVAVELETTGWISMSQPLPTFGSRYEDAQKIAEILSLDESEIANSDIQPMQVVSCGVPFLFVPIRSLEAMRKIRLRADVLDKALSNFETSNLFVFTREVELLSSTVHSRMFAPALGILEDPATGGASGPLGCYLVKNGILKNETEIVSEQGFEMGRPSLIKIAIESKNGEISGVKVSGQCFQVGEGVLNVPS